ncbi:hypothetical protein ACVU7I_14290 [Patulibacter sp. S7RM1-6]
MGVPAIVARGRAWASTRGGARGGDEARALGAELTDLVTVQALIGPRRARKMRYMRRLDERQAVDDARDVLRAASRGARTVVTMADGTEVVVERRPRAWAVVRPVAPRRYHVGWGRRRLSDVPTRPAPGDRAPVADRYGSMKGRIRIADDFDELPDDIADAFGLR